MRIWMHQLLSMFACLGGFLTGGLGAALVLEVIRGGPQWLVIAVVSVCLVGFAIGGIRAGEWLARRIPARCPECNGRTFAEGHRPIRFRCRECGHVHLTKTRTNWGSD